MKKIILATMIAFGILGFANGEANAQVNVSINISSQPAWGPVGYNYAEYYYIPEYNIYFDIARNKYVYLNNRRWVHVAVLPPHLRHIDLYRTHKVVINQHNPFRYNDRHIREYGNYRNPRPQVALRDSRLHNSRNHYAARNNRPMPSQPHKIHNKNDRKRIAENNRQRIDRKSHHDNNRGPRR
jgi:hypothetical protein